MLNRIKSLVNGKDSQQHTLLGESLEELCKEVTNSQIPEIDADSVQQIVEKINGQDMFGRTYTAQEVFQCLKKVLKQDNSQKQYLAIVLTGQVLHECPAKMRSFEENLLSEVASIAAKPSRRGHADMQRRARQQAMALLRGYQGRGQQALRVAAGLEQPRQPHMQGNNTNSQFSGVYNTEGVQYSSQQNDHIFEQVQALIQAATGHTELLEEMILAMTSNEDNQFEMSLCASLVSEIQELKQEFPRVLEILSTLQAPEAEILMAAALESSDSLDNIRAMYESVVSAKQTQQINTQTSQNVKNETNTENATIVGNGENATNVENAKQDKNVKNDNNNISILAYPYKQKQAEDSFPGFDVPSSENRNENGSKSGNLFSNQKVREQSSQSNAANTQVVDPFGLDDLQSGLETTDIQQNSPEQKFDPFDDLGLVANAANTSTSDRQSQVQSREDFKDAN
eukprot:TRINITY_DN18621_c0_g4_i1.p1 TRINITY_DN18621_c0_g4~~TRINITY_DN18621_c0_g4_i1.p1  ORF type:complete len:471 (-),score=71.33 TRINITY_DN18621_c0_g4_i1:1557-2921(-)